MNIAAIIPARGGSKGIPKKNIKDFCGKPLICWTIEQAKQVKSINSVWVTSDDDEILTVSQKYGARKIKRPDSLSGDKATSESAWLHALDEIERLDKKVDIMIGFQCTSPLRSPEDIERGIKSFIDNQYDSMFSGGVLEDFFIWEKQRNGIFNSLNYDYKNRKRRQDVSEQFVENGSFYIFKPEILRQQNNRLGGKIGVTGMELWKSFELDSLEDWKVCELLMKGFLIR
jgi:CMP-N,N'-diacetyllegionaminic acid synthase